MTEWAAWERIHGPLLIHERIDAGFALLAYVLAKVNGAKDVKPEDFLPRWDYSAPDRDSIWTGFQKLVKMAEGNDDADDRNADR